MVSLDRSGRPGESACPGATPGEGGNELSSVPRLDFRGSPAGRLVHRVAFQEMGVGGSWDGSRGSVCSAEAALSVPDQLRGPNGKRCVGQRPTSSRGWQWKGMGLHAVCAAHDVPSRQGLRAMSWKPHGCRPRHRCGTHFGYPPDSSLASSSFGHEPIGYRSARPAPLTFGDVAQGQAENLSSAGWQREIAPVHSVRTSGRRNTAQRGIAWHSVVIKQGWRAWIRSCAPRPFPTSWPLPE